MSLKILSVLFLYCLCKTKGDDCSTHLSQYLSDLPKFEAWALQMFDATSKIQSGLTHGNIVDLGDYDLCMDLQYNTTKNGVIKGKYCRGMMQISIDPKMINKMKETFKNNELILKTNSKEVSSLSWYWSFCIPDSCTPERVVPLLNILLQSVLPLKITELPSNGYQCQSRDTIDTNLSSGAIATIVFFAVIMLLMVIDTVYDTYLHYAKKEPWHDILVAFSVFKNGKKLLQVTQRKEQLHCLDGIRVLSMLWVIFGHRLSLMVGTLAFVNSTDLLTWADQLYTMYIGAGTLSVDTFFLIGGMLVSYNFMKASKRGVPFNLPKFYIHRYLRLTPAFAALLLPYTQLIIYMFNGPDWQTLASDPFCKKYWWSSLLYIQNWVNIDEFCIGHSWYLNIDMQMYFLSPLLLIPLSKWPKVTLSATGILIVLSSGSCFYVAKHFGMYAMWTTPFRATDINYITEYYFRTYTRANVWLIGFLLGYVMFRIKNNEIKFKLTKLQIFALWSVCIALLETCIYAGHGTLRDAEYDVWGNALHITFIRPVWAIAVSLLILACTNGYGGPINWFLSLPVFQILNKFTYSIYLVHVLVETVMVYTRRTNQYFNDYNTFFLTTGDFSISFFFALLWILAFESPILTIEKFLFGLGKKKEREPPKEKVNEA